MKKLLRHLHYWIHPVIGELAVGTSIDRARAEMDTIGRRIAAENPRSHRDRFVVVGSLNRGVS